LYSVEHDAGFASLLRPLLADPNILIQREAGVNPSPRIRSRKEPDRDFFDYVHAIDAVPGDFDLVVVDGRARIACVQMALGRLKPCGLILLDDSWRREYREGLARLPLQIHHLPGAAPCLPYPSVTALLSTRSTRPGAHDQVG
jgi:predicted O-methyltransferase YrrM